MVYLRSTLALPILGFTVPSLLCAFQCYSGLLWDRFSGYCGRATQDYFGVDMLCHWSMRCGRTTEDYSRLLWEHCGGWAVEGPLWCMWCGRVGYSEPTLVDVLWKGCVLSAVEGLWGLLWAHFWLWKGCGLLWNHFGKSAITLVEVLWKG